MRKEQNRRKPNQRYIVTTFKDRKLKQSIVTFNELQKIKQEETDLFINEPAREVSYQSQEGKRIDYEDGIPCVGSYEWRLLLDILWAAGEWVDLDSANYINARVLRVRKAFSGSKKTPWLFQTRRNPTYAIRWNPSRSWRFLEKKAETCE
jgi:hypothetical protein